MTTVDRLSVLYYSADYISFPFGSVGSIVVYLKMDSVHVYARGRSSFANFISIYEESQ